MIGSILVISGPSGAGKSTLIKELLKSINFYYFSISTTTRPPREGEIHGVDYFFVDKETFLKGIKDELFLEYALVHGNYYGTSLKYTQDALSKGKLVIFDIDIQGHKSIKKRLQEITTSVFIIPPSFNSLKQRLAFRNTDSKDMINKRLIIALKELEHINDFDFVIINKILDESIKEIKAVALVSRLKKSFESLNLLKEKWKVL